MFNVLVRDIEERDLELLKRRAEACGRSLQAELKRILQLAARASERTPPATWPSGSRRPGREVAPGQHRWSARTATDERRPHGVPRTGGDRAARRPDRGDECGDRPPYVIDTSVAVKWYIPEALAAEARRYMGRAIDRHAPDYLPAESASVVLKRVRTRDEGLRLTADEGHMVLAALQAAPDPVACVGAADRPGLCPGRRGGHLALRRPVPGPGDPARRPGW